MQKVISGKVRDVYSVSGKELVIVTTDRISAFDVILPTPIPGKGIVLNRLSSFWFDYTRDIVPNHIVSESTADVPEFFRKNEFQGRTVMVKKLKMLPYELIVRGYLFGSMWNAYQTTGEFCGYTFNRKYELAEKLDAPILTPSAKSEQGHDVNISMQEFRDGAGAEMAEKLEAICLALYRRCAEYALSKGIIIADTKFEFGQDEHGNLVLADEIFTPDSSRFWDAQSYRTGMSPKSYDKQFVRDWLIEQKLDGAVPPPEIPDDISQKTAAIYAECLRKITE